jgi:beta-glucosidase
VLLKNEGGLLPLKPSVTNIEVVGPSANDPISLLGNYNGISSKQVTPLEGIQRQFPGATIRYVLGATHTSTSQALIDSSFLVPPEGSGEGLEAEYFDNPDFQGQPTLRRMEARVYFDANTEEPAVLAAVGGNKYSIRWSGALIPPATGDYVISARTGIWNREGRMKLFLDEKEVSPNGSAGARPAGLGPGQGQGPRGAGPAPVQLEGGRKYAVKVEYTQNGPGGGAQLNWIPPAAAMLAEAEKVARESDVTLVFVGLNGSQEGEGHDRSAIDLPEPQESLIHTLIATSKPLVVILTSGSAVAINSAAASATAVLSAWYGGEETGTAIAETLAGVNNPAGRLPVTFYKSLDQLPAFTDYSMKGRTYRYFHGEPLYPFGYGLSYSTFAYSSLKAKRTASGAEIRATVKNTSSREGDEVVQLYISGGAEADAPIRSLRGFQRIRLRAGESRVVNFVLPHDELPKGKVAISVGGGQPIGSTPRATGLL